MLTRDGEFNIVILFIFQSNENIAADIDSVPCPGGSWVVAWLFLICWPDPASPTKICNYNLNQNYISDRNLLGTCQDRL